MNGHRSIPGRDSRLAGRWYPADPGSLRRGIRALLDQAEPVSVPEPVRALILPHAGYEYSGAVAAAGLRALRGPPPRRVVLLGPAHRIALPDAAAVPDPAPVRTPLGEVPPDGDALERLRGAPGMIPLPAGDPDEHSLEIHLPMLQVALGPSFRAVPVLTGPLSPRTVRRVAAALRPVLDAGTLLVVSTDFTHYGPRFGYLPFRTEIARRLEALDLGAFEPIRNRDLAGFESFLRETGATICGQDALRVLLRLMEGGTQRVERILYRTSAGRTGEERESVSYLSAAVCGPWPHEAGFPGPGGSLPEADRRLLWRLAREAIARRLGAGDPAPGPGRETGGFPRAGAFVTLTIRGALRGCIGEIPARRPLDRAVADLAVRAAFEDPRFPPLSAEEWPETTVEVSVLTAPRPVASWEEIEPGRHGVWLRKGRSQAVFLPQVAAEQGWDRETLLARLALKAGLEPDAWREGASLEVFEAEILRGPDAAPPDGSGPAPPGPRNRT